jgi:predicted Zn-dependent protease
VPHAGATYLVTGMAPSMRAGAYEGRFLSTARSFGPLAPERRAALRVERVRIATARPGETLVALSQRAGNAWDLQTTAVSNALFTDHRFAGGEWVKVTDEERVVASGAQGPRSTSGR